jgi:hypothetical protein
MSDDDGAHDQIAQLEAQIEELAATVESCRKIMLLAKVAIAGGALLIIAMLVGAISPGFATLSGATAAVLSGIVLLGSNRSTADQAMAKMNQAEAARAGLIDRLEFRTIQGGSARQAGPPTDPGSVRIESR